MKFFLTDGFHHHHIQSRDRSPPQHRMQNLSGFSEKSNASARTKSVTGFCGCDMQVAETKTARFPEETAPFQNPSIQEKCLWAAKNVRQCEKSGKACKCAQGNAPARFLSGFFHDYSSYSLSGGSSRPGPLEEAFIKIRRRRQMQKAAK
ncbi:hypothetical protein [Agrobacterium burrii]|nr:hypothetical protein [Agrobacterium burrii]MBO0132329.1 hypothetical protein [Agrobacterium burrii]